MGVSGSGKTTVGELLAERLGVDFGDADDFHPAESVAKMAAGTPLTDHDRQPWLTAIAEWLADRADRGAVVTCSALKRAYRDVLRAGAPDVWFLHLEGSPELVTERVAERTDHFMPADLVESQFDTLEPLGADERGVVIDATRSPTQIVEAFLAAARRAS